MNHLRLLAVGLGAVVLVPAAGAAQGRLHPRWEIPGFDFHRDGVWRKQARRVAANRARLLAQHQFGTLNAPMAAGVPMSTAQAVSGILTVPAILFKYLDTPPAEVRTTAAYDAVLFASTPPPGRPYTYRTFYEQLSSGLLSVQGQTYGYAQLDSNEATYNGGTSSICLSNNPFKVNNCNGLFSDSAVARMQRGLVEALQKLDPSVNFSQYDSDKDGFVDLVVFIPPTRDGACGGNNHLWSHRFVLTTPYTTNDLVPPPGTGFEKVRDYILQSGVGGASSCDSTLIMPIGTVAHETGHGFGLPDLYDVSGQSEGIGEWGLMGSGNYTSPFSPSRMEAWSLNELGWVTLAPLTVAGTYSFGAATPTGDSAFLIRPAGSNLRGEYFLLENRQPVLADSAMIAIHCQVSGQPPTCPGGLLIWHVDSAQVVNGGATNDVNVGAIHGLELIQADGLRNLDTSTTSPASNRGDAGDLYPGTTGNVRFAFNSNPAAVLNADGSFAGFAVDQITQVMPNARMSFRLQFGYPLLAISSAGTLPIGVKGVTLADTLRASGGNGLYSWQLASGTLAAGLSLATTGIISGTPTQAGTFSFQAQVTSLSQQQTQAFTLTVNAAPTLATAAVVAQLLNGTGTLTPDDLRYLDLIGNKNGQFDVGDFRAWVDSTGAPLAAPIRATRGTAQVGHP